MAGTEVRVRRIGRGVLLEPIEQDRADVAAIFAEIDRQGGANFIPDGRALSSRQCRCASRLRGNPTYSPLIFAALMIGHHFSASAL